MVIVTAQQQTIQLPDGARAVLEAAALLDEPFSIPLLIDLGFSADALDPLFDNAIFPRTVPKPGRIYGFRTSEQASWPDVLVKKTAFL
jgi:hypothetical protein